MSEIMSPLLMVYNQKGNLVGHSASFTEGYEEAMKGRDRCPLRSLTDADYLEGHNIVVRWNALRNAVLDATE